MTFPFARFEWMLAGRYLRARRRESFISVASGFSLVGIALGVATLIVVMAVMNGFRIELMDRVLGVNGHIMIYGATDGRLYDFDRTADLVESLEGVERVAPIVQGQVMASANDLSSGALVRGVREADLKAFKVVSDKILSGTLDGFDGAGGIAVGSRLAQSMGVGVDGQITLISPRGAVTPFGMTPRIKSYPVVAVFEIGMSEYDASFVFMPFDEAQLYFNVENAATALEIMVDDPDNVDSLRALMQAELDQPARIFDWKQTNSTFVSALEVEKNVMFLILTLIILVASLNIISGLIMLVKDKGQDIAVLRSMGATRGAVMRVFFIAGSAIGVVGTFAGLTIGVVFCANIETLRQWLSSLTGTELFSPEIYFLATMPAEIVASEVAAIVFMALGLSFMATLYPSWRAARLDPVEALRYE